MNIMRLMSLGLLTAMPLLTSAYTQAQSLQSPDLIQYSDYKGLPPENQRQIVKYRQMMDDVAEQMAQWREDNPSEVLSETEFAQLANDYSQQSYGMSAQQIIDAYHQALEVTMAQ